MTTSRGRPLTGDERRVLGLLLSLDFPGVEELRQQATDAEVVGRCECGCPSVALAPDAAHPPANLAGGLAPVELTATSSTGEVEGEVILFVSGGRLSYLEYVYYTDHPSEDWPPWDRLTIANRTP